MGMWSNVLSWVEKTARSWRGSPAETRLGRLATRDASQAPSPRPLRGSPPARPPRQRRGDAGSYVMSGMLGADRGGWPGGWTNDRVELVSHYRHWTFVAVRAIQNEIAGLTPRVALVGPGGHRQRSHFPARLKSVGAVAEHEAVTEVGPLHPLATLFGSPNPWDVACEFWGELVLFLELCGIAFVWCVPNGAGLPCQLWVIPSHWVWRRPGAAGPRYYEIRPLVGGGTWKLPADEVIELKYKSPVSKLDGASSQMAGAEWIDAGESIDRSRFFQFKNGCFPSGAVELGDGYNDPDDADLERIYAKFFARLQGENNTGRPIITPPGAKYVPLVISPLEMGYVQSADQLRDWILALYGVPKEVAGIQDAGSEIAMYGPLLQFGRLTIVPKLRYLGQALTRHLAQRYDPLLRVWWDYELPVSPDQLNRDIQVDAGVGAVMPNEIRALRGRRPYTREEEDRYADPAVTSPRGSRPSGGQGAQAQAGGTSPRQRAQLNGANGRH